MCYLFTLYSQGSRTAGDAVIIHCSASIHTLITGIGRVNKQYGHCCIRCLFRCDRLCIDPWWFCRLLIKGCNVPSIRKSPCDGWQWDSSYIACECSRISFIYSNTLGSFCDGGRFWRIKETWTYM